MIPSAFSDTPDSPEEQNFEQLIQDGITAVKTGNRALAVERFEQAAMIDDTDVRIWIWMSATTDDLEERRKYLEHAITLDPSNAIAKRGLSIVMEKLGQARQTPEPAPPAPQEPAPIEEASTKTYLCPNCGATISYNIHETVLVCQFCGFTRKVDAAVASESKDQTSDEAVPAVPAQRWVESQARITCEQCGVVIIQPAGQTADSCPYCGSNRFAATTSLVEMVDPQVIGLFKVDPKNASNNIRDWLGKGWLAPDNLAAEHGGMHLHPAYYPFWLFVGSLEIPWFCDVNVGTSTSAQWEAHSGSHFEDVKDILIPGIRKLSLTEVAGIEPFKLDELIDFLPDHLTGGVALAYDHPLADASLLARDKVFKAIQNSLPGLVEPNHPKRNFSTGTGKWSGLNSKLALLPIYIGNYLFQGERYRLLVNGQTGKVSGKKPTDRVKVAMVVIIGIILLVVLLAILFLLGRAIIG
jgi:DNA-directed RNA polymerase subunit RPC12/RpoP